MANKDYGNIVGHVRKVGKTLGEVAAQGYGVPVMAGRYKNVGESIKKVGREVNKHLPLVKIKKK